MAFSGVDDHYSALHKKLQHLKARCTICRRHGDLTLLQPRSPSLLDRVAGETAALNRGNCRGKVQTGTGFVGEPGTRSGTGCVMVRVRSGARYGLRYSVLGLTAVATALTVSSDAADAWHHHRARVRYVHHEARHTYTHSHHYAHVEDYSPPSASIVVDGNSGAVLQATNPDAARHPASLTKIMTLYLLFERLDAGKLKLDSQLKVSEHAAEQDPTKLGLKPGQTIAVEDAIKGVVTRSANDAAVVIAENLGGDEESFAKLMTQKARALGMTRTTYVNASGLPDDDQVTTARDQALLGRAIQDRFPRYYKYFSTETFVYHGEAIRNHNHLLGSIEGVDGIKTGFTRASGFNLVTSVHRDGRFIVAVVLGGHSSFERDSHMRELIGAHIKEAAQHRTAPTIAEEQQPVAFAKSALTATSAPMSSHSEPAAAAATVDAHPGSSDPIRPLLVKTVTFRTAPVQSASLAPMPAMVPVAAAAPAPQPVARALPAAAPAADQRMVVASAEPAPAPVAEAAPSAANPLPAEATGPVADAPSPPEQVLPPEPLKHQPIIAPLKVEVMPKAEPKSEPKPEPKAEIASSIPAAAPSHIRGGWLIQIGAFDGEDEARQHLTDAQSKVRDALAAADPFTERVQKGDKALYRARFAGFDKTTAEAACKQLKRSDFECMALKD
jgi:D-alanyl-D-alanine carboxypeptidase